MAKRKDILARHVVSKDRVAYYSSIALWGDDYGYLALDVITANHNPGNYALYYMKENSKVELNDIDVILVSIILMENDYNKRREENFLYLSYKDILEYHSEVFDSYGIGKGAWTIYYPLKYFESVYGEKRASEYYLSVLDISVKYIKEEISYLEYVEKNVI